MKVGFIDLKKSKPSRSQLTAKADRALRNWWLDQTSVDEFRDRVAKARSVVQLEILIKEIEAEVIFRKKQFGANV